MDDSSPLDVSSLRELEALVSTIATELSADDWDVRFAALKSLRCLVLGNASSDFVEFASLLRSDISNGLIAMINDPRSQIVREVTDLCGLMAENLGDGFATLAEAVVPALLNLTYVTIQVMNECSDHAIKRILANTMPSPGLVGNFVKTALTTKHAMLRRRVVEYIGQLLKERSTERLARSRADIETLILSVSADASAPVRQGSRLCWWLMQGHWPDRAQDILAKMDSRAVQLIAKEKGKSWDDFIAEGQPKFSALKSQGSAVEKKAAKPFSTPSAVQKKKPLLSQLSSPAPPETHVPSPQESLKAVKRSVNSVSLNKVTVVKSPTPAPTKYKKFAPETPGGFDSAPSTPLVSRPDNSLKKPTATSKFAQFAPSDSNGDLSLTPTPKMTRPTPTQTPKVQAKTPAPIALSPFEQILTTLEKGAAADSDKRRDQFRSLNGSVLKDKKFIFTETELERVFAVYRTNLNDQSLESIDELVRGLTELLKNAEMDRLLPKWSERLTPGLLKFFSVSKASKTIVESFLEVLAEKLTVAMVLKSALDSFDAELSSPKVKMGGVRYLQAIMSCLALAQSLGAAEIKSILQKVANCNPWYKGQQERADAIAVFQFASAKFGKEFKAEFGNIVFDKIGAKNKQLQKTVARLIGLTEGEGSQNPSSALESLFPASNLPMVPTDLKPSNDPNKEISSLDKESDLKDPLPERKALSPLRTPKGAKVSKGIKSPFGKENAANSPKSFITIRNAKGPEVPATLKSKPQRPFEFIASEFDLSQSDIAALSAINEGPTWTSFELLNAVDAAVRLISMGDSKSFDLGKKSIDEALTRSKPVTDSSLVKLLQRVPFAHHSTLIQNRIDSNIAIDKFISDFAEICVDKSGVATLTHLLVNVPKSDLIAKLKDGALLRALLEGITHPNALTRRESVMAFARLSIHLGADFDPFLDQLNPRERKLVHVYKEKQSQPQQPPSAVLLSAFGAAPKTTIIS